MPPSIDFSRIRGHAGSQHLGFEELCCQLAGLEQRPFDATFLRKGAGSDQGVECYVKLADGGELAWQAKYFFSGFDDGQVRQLDDSLSRALAAHPRLRTYTVCMPIDLSDLRTGRKLSPLQLYEKWRDKRIKEAAQTGRTLEIYLWGASQIRERLIRDTPLYSGRLRYWFDTERLAARWFSDRFDVAKENLGKRYTAESHVDLPIQQALLALARDKAFVGQTITWGERLSKHLGDAHRALSGASMNEALAKVSAPVVALIASLEQRRDQVEDCPRRPNFDPPCRLNFDPGLVAEIA